MTVITGAGAISAIGLDRKEMLRSLRSMSTGIAPVRFLNTVHKDYFVGEVKKSNEELAAGFGLNSGEYARTSLMAVHAIDEALKEARLTKEDLKSAALVSGTTVGTLDLAERDILTGKGKVHELGSCGESTLKAAETFGEWDFVTTCSTACSSGANSFILGSLLIEAGIFDKVVVGASESLSTYHFNGFRSLMIMDPDLCRPFDARRKGLNLGEGAAFFVLESEQSAKARNIKPLAVVSGWGNACDAYHQTATSPDALGPVLAMTKALQKAGLKPEDIGYVNAHGTATPNNDETEVLAFRKVFGERLPLISSTKSLTGHATSSSGAIEMAICLDALLSGTVPGTYNWGEPMADGFRPLAECANVPGISHIMCNSFGFGGNDSSLVLSRYAEGKEDSAPKPLRPVYVRARMVPEDILPEEMPAIPPMQARRMSKLIKNALTTSYALLKRTGCECPDAIVTGTDKGCLSDSVKFISDLLEHGEGVLSPTCFMNSTHNMIGSKLALQLHCHSYNNTYSQGSDSLKSALLDAFLQIGLGYAGNALVGWYDEVMEASETFFLTCEDSEDKIMEIKNLKDIDILCGNC